VPARERFVGGDVLLRLPGEFRYVECAGCRTVYQDPCVVDEDLALLYPGGYFTHDAGFPWEGGEAPPGSARDRLKSAVRQVADGAPGHGHGWMLRLFARALALHPGLRRRARFGLVDGLAPAARGQPRCLEVGPGVGLDLVRLARLGWEACGLDIDPVAAANAQARSGCRVRVGTLDSTDYPSGWFDLVYMSHVFEHLRDPVRAAERCMDLLVPGGRLVLVYPNPEGMTARLHGRFSPVFDPPRHLVLPPVRSVAVLLRKAGFTDVRPRTMAREAATFHAAARTLGAGRTWDWTRPQPPGLRDKLLAALEGLLVALRLPAGEEALVSARRPGAR
jgi:SAM-dependent methyltransferase